MPSLVPGQLVAIAGPADAAGCPAAWRSEYPGWRESGADLSGRRGQLVEWCEESGRWLVVTIDGAAVAVREGSLRPLGADDVSDFDLALGPRSDPDVYGAELAELLQSNGCVLCQMFVSSEDLATMCALAERCRGEGRMERLPLELEPGYLGEGGRGRTMELDLGADVEEWLAESPLRSVEESVSAVGQALQPYTDRDFGFDIHSRSTTMLMLPVGMDEDNHDVPDCENERAVAFLTMMHRAKIAVVVNAGTSDGQLRLMPKRSSTTAVVAEEERRLLIPPGSIAAFLTDRYKFAYQPPSGQSLTLLSWYLDTPRTFGVSDLGGDLAALGSLASGPPVPSGEQAVVSAVAARYAFGMDEPWKLWAGYCKAGVDTLIEFPYTRWDVNEYWDPDADQTSNMSYTRHGGFSEGIELFDAKFFDISPAEARGMDPTQRQVLEVSYMALAGGGFTKQGLQAKPEQVGCFVGLDKNEWLFVPKEAISGGFAASSGANSITSNRVNYCLNLKGPSMTLDTACSASLVATHTAKLYLNNKMWDPCVACIATGVNLLLSPATYVSCCGAGMLSHKGRCFTYNNTADGYARGESTASVCLKLHAYDREKGDMCVLAGSNVNQDGRSASLTAPNGPAQERCTLSVLREVGITPAEVDTTECHGTGTPLGDPIELGAYRRVMSTVNRTEPVVITSSKSNIGHCEGSAGISGFIKCILMSMHAEGTPNCHLAGLNPHIQMEDFPALLLTEGVTLRADATYNGVLSFGFGGTNASAQCWGQNTLTSRGNSSGDMYKALVRKIESAPAKEVNFTGDSWEEWQYDGPDFTARPGDAWTLEISEEGDLYYTRKEKEPAERLGDRYFLAGSFSSWQHRALEPDSLLSGLYAGIVELGAGGEELFQVVADEDPDLTFYPESEKPCRTKSEAVRGPSRAPSRDAAWCLRGRPGDRFRVEFYRSESDAFTISWRREL